MAEALPDDPVARAKAIALKLTATTTPGEDAPAPAPAEGAAPAPASESELGKRKNRWGEDPQPAVSMPAGFGLPAALLAQATAGAAAATARNKIMVPVKEHPEFNFMGVLIGPRGSSLKAMEQRTGAKILIRGRGSTKEPSSDPEANEDMNVVIEGTEQAVALATQEIETIFKDPQRALIVKSEQLKNLADLNGGGGGGASFGAGAGGAGAYGPAGGEDYEVEMGVPSKMVGLIIGRGGSNIQSMQRDYQITIQIASQSDVPPGSETRPVKLKGGRQSVEQCRTQINQIIKDRENELQGGFNPGGVGGGGGAGAYGPGGASATNHLTIPDDKVGLVIGKGGGTIKGVQGRTGANIQIPGEADANDRTKRTIVISASTQDAADRAMAEVQNILSADAAAMGSTSGIPPGSQVLYVVIPDDKVGLVIGKGGSTIKDLQNRTGCRIQIPSQTDPGTHPPTRRVTLTGVGESPHNAKREIEMMVQDDDNRGGRYGGGGPPPHQGYGPPGGRYGAPPAPYGAPPMQGFYGAPHPHQPYQPAPYGHPPPQQYQPAPYQPYGQPPPQQPAYPQPVPYQPAPQAAPAPAPEQAPAPGHMPQQQQQQPGQQQQQQQPGQQQQQPQQQQQQQYYQQPQAPAPAQAPTPAAAAPTPAPAPGAVDMTQYHDQFWQYAAYYGEQVARDQYGAWAPPAGTPPPPGITVPAPGQANPPPQS